MRIRGYWAQGVIFLADIPAGSLPRGGVDDVFTATIASPLPCLFAEQRHADRQAREALFCSFNADLGFFERTVLGVTQASGARATVVGDAACPILIHARPGTLGRATFTALP